MQESLASEHSGELLADTLEELLNRGGVSDKSRRHGKTTRGNGTQSGLDVVGNPLDEVRGVLVLDVSHLVLDLLHGNATTAVTVSNKFTKRNADSAEGVSTTAGQGGKADHKEVQTGERNHVDGKLSEVRVQLTRETETGGDTGHNSGDEVVEVTVGGVRQLQGSHANVVEGFVVDTERLIGVLDQLVDGESGVIGLNDSVGDLRGRNNGEGGHHSVGELLTDLGNEQRTHTSTSTTTERVGDLEALEAIAALGLTADDIKDLVDELSSLSVMTLRPVVSSTRLAENEVVGSEKLTERTSADGIHGTGLQIDEDGTRDVLVAGSLYAHALELKLRGAVVDTIAVKAMLARDGLPESSTNLVTLINIVSTPHR
ncbi:hypothetical protein HG530_015347 [Fusarium avenaceum]|nr:hypothetical protein HG530_015347 [Fusarium avenaceum]